MSSVEALTGRIRRGSVTKSTSTWPVRNHGRARRRKGGDQCGLERRPGGKTLARCAPDKCYGSGLVWTRVGSLPDYIILVGAEYISKK